MTKWSSFPESTDFFGEGVQQAMVIYRVDNLDESVQQLSEAGAKVEPKIEQFSYGKFACARDTEGGRFEFWQPIAASSGK